MFNDLIGHDLYVSIIKLFSSNGNQKQPFFAIGVLMKCVFIGWHAELFSNWKCEACLLSRCLINYLNSFKLDRRKLTDGSVWETRGNCGMKLFLQRGTNCMETVTWNCRINKSINKTFAMRHKYWFSHTFSIYWCNNYNIIGI